jgi:Malectin domain/Domain of unknown function (DUF5122) beta-propeller
MSVRPPSRALAASLAMATTAAMLLAFVPPVSASPVSQNVVVSADPADWTPNIARGNVKAIVQVGEMIVAGGHFHEVDQTDGTSFYRRNIVGFDATTGLVTTTFHPSLNDNVYALATDGTNIYAGGVFTKVDGTSAPNIVELGPDGEVIAAFQAAVTKGTQIESMALANGVLYIAGTFTKVDGTTRNGFAGLDPTTGALVPGIADAFTGVHHPGGTSHVLKIVVSPDGSKLVAIGNFAAVDGEPRDQVAVLDLAPGTSTLDSWSTARFDDRCATLLDTYLRAVDISPDGTYFVVGTTGGFANGANIGVLCDTATRWDLTSNAADQQPQWIDYAGGDSTYALTITGAAVYVGGHERWWNNPYGGNKVGPGTVRRPGIAALDPINGMPLPWNPTRKLGKGVFAFLPTDQGLWVGSDTNIIGHEVHSRIALFPLDGGEAVPEVSPSTLPGTFYSLPAPGCPAIDPTVLYRVNAGGRSISSTDCGPDWSPDTVAAPSSDRNGGSVAEGFGPVPYVAPGIPAATPLQVFETDRRDPSAKPEMRWSFPVAPGTPVTVRLYFSTGCFCVFNKGDRVFDVSISGKTVLSKYDNIADVGFNTAVMKTFSAKARAGGAVKIAFGHVTGDPFISAIEILDPNAVAVSEPRTTAIPQQSFDGTTFGTPGEFSTQTDWTKARGAFWVNDTLIYGWEDGNMYMRSFDGTTLGSSKELLLHALAGYLPVTSLTGMFYDDGRLYYTLKGEDTLYMRYFEFDHQVVGAQPFVASTPSDGFSWGTARGMTMAAGTVYVARTDGSLSSIAWADGTPVTGSETVVDTSRNWTSHGLFLLPAV